MKKGDKVIVVEATLKRLVNKRGTIQEAYENISKVKVSNETHWISNKGLKLYEK